MTNKEGSQLFNRTYLKLMPVLVGAIILWLSLSNRGEKAPDVETLTPNQTYLYIDKTATRSQLHLTYAVAPGLSYQQSEYRHAIITALGQALTDYPALSADWFDDRVTLHIPTTLLKTRPLSQLIDHLTNDVFNQYPEALKRAAAEQYLAQNQRENQALQNLTQQIAGYRASLSAQQIFSQPPLALLTLSRSDKKLTRRITEQVAILPNRAFNHDEQSASSLSVPTSIQLTHRGSGYLYMLGHALSVSDTDKIDLIASHVLSQQLSALTANTETHFRLVQKPLFPVGYWALLLNKDTPFSPGFEERLRESIEQSFTDEQLASTRTFLFQQYRDQLLAADSRTTLINQSLFYRQPIASANEFRDTLDAITLTQIIARLNEWLDPNRSLTLLIEPQ